MPVAEAVTPPDTTKELRDSQITKPPGYIEARIKRGRSVLDDIAPARNECFEFHKGNQYVFRDSNNKLAHQSTNIGPGVSKPAHRIRQVRNVLIDVVEAEVSAATSRVPAYEINPTTVDPEDVGAARLAQKVANYGYDKWNIRSVTEAVAFNAIVGDEGFAWPYFNTTVGDRIQGDVHTGEVKIRVLGPNEVYWEPGVPFHDSRWHVVEQARPRDEVYALPGYLGGKLTADASANGITNAKTRDITNMVLVTEYLERPSAKNANGARITIANGRQITPPQAYPCVDPKGTVVDEPVLHRLTFFADTGTGRETGLVRHLIDPQRTINDSVNKGLEWKNLALNPQVLAPLGSMITPLTDEPGKIFEYQAIGQSVPEWRKIPPVPQELFQFANEAKADIQNIAAQNQVPQQVESGKGISALIEKDNARRGRFINHLAEFHSRLMRDCLYLVQRHYSERRLLTIRGRFGPEVIPDFMGAQLRGQADVTVLPGSIEPRTRAAMEQRIMAYAQSNWISPQAAMAAINDGSSESLIDGYELDIARANLVVQKIKDINRGGTDVPIPRPFDDLTVHKSIVSDWCKTTDFDSSGPLAQQAATDYIAAVEQLQQQQAAKQAQAQQDLAASQGMANAAAPQAPPLPPEQAQEQVQAAESPAPVPA